MVFKSLNHFFLQFVNIAEKSQKAIINTTTSRSPVLCISQILTTFNLYSGKPGMGLSVNNKKTSDKQWVRFKEGEWATPHWPDLVEERAGLTYYNHSI